LRQHLLNLARSRGIDFNVVLQRYAVERFLYRLSASSEVDRFTLKGATLFRVWDQQELRPTRDVDLLALEPPDRMGIRASLETVCGVPCAEDAVLFASATIRLYEIRHDHPYGGVRVRLEGRLGPTRLPLQIDIAFGDVITPERQLRDYPTLLELPAPRVWTYPRETLVAEKFETMVRFGTTNSRVKDIWDIACVARRFPFDGETLRDAIRETFRRRRTAFAADRPAALLPAYYEDLDRDQRWQVLRRRIGHADGPLLLPDAGEELRAFLGPIYDSLVDGRRFGEIWEAGGPWHERAKPKKKRAGPGE